MPQSSPSCPRVTIFLPSNPNHPLMTTTTPTICPSAGCQAPSSSTPTVLSTNLNIHEAAEGRLNFPLAMTIIRHLGPEGEKPLAQLTESSALAFFFRFLASPPHHRIFVLFIPDITSLSDRRRKKRATTKTTCRTRYFASPALHYPPYPIHFLSCIISIIASSALSPSPCITPPHQKNQTKTIHSRFNPHSLIFASHTRHPLDTASRFMYNPICNTIYNRNHYATQIEYRHLSIYTAVPSSSISYRNHNTRKQRASFFSI